MHDTLPNVELPKGGERVNVNTTLGIAIGTPISIKSLSASSARIYIKATEPSDSDGYKLIVKGDKYTIDTGSNIVWASSQGGGAINVQAIVEQGIVRDAWNVQKVSSDKSLFHGLFTFDVSPYMWNIEEDGVEVINSISTRATSVNGHLDLKSGGIAGNTCIVESRRHPRYQPDRGIKWASSIGFKGASLDGILKAGLIVGSENGIYFKTKGDGSLYACVLNDGVEIEELIVFPFTIDITLGNNYDIQAQWRGVGFVKFFSANPSTGQLEKVHEINFLNSLDESVLLRNPAMSASYHAENITQEVSLWSGCVDITSEGGSVDREQYGEHSADRTVTAGATSGGVLALRSPNLAPNGKINTRDISLARVTITADKKSTFKVYQTRDLTAITAGTWVAHRDGSFIEANDTFTALDFAKMQDFSTFKPAAGATIIKSNPSKGTIDFYITHGDYIVIACVAGNVVAAEVSIEWGEEI